MLVHYTIKGVKKGHKKYKERQAEKERKILEDRGQLPDIQDPSRELDTTCLAEADSKSDAIVTNIDRSNSTNSASTASALSALDNDPEFQRYMERQKQLYIQQQREQAAPPSYDASIQEMPTSPSPLTASVSHPAGNIAELPESTDISARPVEIGGKQIPDAHQPVEADSTPIVFELPGDLPAIMPESKQSRNNETANHNTKSEDA